MIGVLNLTEYKAEFDSNQTHYYLLKGEVNLKHW